MSESHASHASQARKCIWDPPGILVGGSDGHGIGSVRDDGHDDWVLDLSKSKTDVVAKVDAGSLIQNCYRRPREVRSLCGPRSTALPKVTVGHRLTQERRGVCYAFRHVVPCVHTCVS